MTKKKLSARQALIAWTPSNWPASGRTDAPRGQVRVGSLLSDGENVRDWTFPFACTGGAAWIERRTIKGDALLARVLLDFQSLVVRDGLDPLAVHRAFLAIREYRNALAPDCPT